MKQVKSDAYVFISGGFYEKAFINDYGVGNGGSNDTCGWCFGDN